MLHQKRHVYALFDHATDATAALKEAQLRGCRDQQCSILMQRDILDEELLPLSETAAREGAKKGALAVGVVGAAVAGLIAMTYGLLGVGPFVAALFGGLWGATFGALLGSLMGSAEPTKLLRKVEAEVNAGKVLLAVETDTRSLARMCRRVFAAHGGRQVV